MANGRLRPDFMGVGSLNSRRTPRTYRSTASEEAGGGQSKLLGPWMCNCVSNCLHLDLQTYNYKPKLCFCAFFPTGGAKTQQSSDLTAEPLNTLAQLMDLLLVFKKNMWVLTVLSHSIQEHDTSFYWCLIEFLSSIFCGF